MARPIPRLASLVALLAVALHARSAVADERVELEWIAPAACPTKDQVTSAVNRQLPTAPDASRVVRARAVVEETSNERNRGWRVTLATSNGERTIEAATCDEIADAVALILVLAIDPTRVPPPRPKPEESTTPPREGPAREAPKSAPSVDRDPRFVVGAGPIADVGTLPSAAFGAEILVALRISSVAARFELSGAYWATNRSDAANSFGAGGDFRMLSAFARACFLPTLDRFELGGCAGGGVDRVSADSFGGIANSTNAASWSALGAEGRASYVIRPWLAARVGVGFSAPLSRPTFVIEGVGPVHQASAVSLRSSLGLELRFL